MNGLNLKRIETTSRRHGRRIGVEVELNLEPLPPASRLSTMKRRTFLEATMRKMICFYFWEAVSDLDCDCEQRYTVSDTGSSVTAFDLHPTHPSWSNLESIMETAVLSMMADLGFGPVDPSEG